MSRHRPALPEPAFCLAAMVALLAMDVGCDGGGDGDVLKIAAVISTTGPSAEMGLFQLNGAALAAEEINSLGGVLGRPLRLVHHDDAVDVSRAENIAAALSKAVEPASGALEPIGIGAVESRITVELANDLLPGFVLVSSSSTADSVGEIADDGYLFPLGARDSGQGRLLAQRAIENNRLRVVVVHSGLSTESDLADAFTVEFNALGGFVPLTKRFTPGRPDFEGLANVVHGENPEAILLDAAVRDAGEILAHYLNLFPDSNVFWLFTDSLNTPAFLSQVGASKFMFPHLGVGAAASADHYARFERAYERRYQPKEVIQGTYGANAYDSVYLIALAIETAGSTDAAAVRQALTEVASVGTAYDASQYSAALAAVTRGEDIDFQGASGSLDFDATGWVPDSYDLWQVSGGAIRTMEASVTPAE